MTYNELKTAFIAALPEDYVNLPGRRPRSTVTFPEHKWQRHVLESVVGTEQFSPCSDAKPFVFSSEYTAHGNLGGMIVERLGGYPATEEAVDDASWVLVNYEGKFIAVSLQEAFMHGLNEAVWPDTDK